MRYHATIQAAAFTDSIDRTPEPEFEELTPGVLTRTDTRVVDRRGLLAIALAGAIVGYGFLTADGPRDRVAQEAALPEPTMPHAALVVVAPSERAAVSAPAVHVRGHGATGSRQLRVSVVVGSIVLGASTVDPVAGSFEANVPIVAPNGGPALDASLVVEDLREGTELARRALTIARTAPVTLIARAIRTESGWFAAIDGRMARNVVVDDVLVGGVTLAVQTRSLAGPGAGAAMLFGVQGWEARGEFAAPAAASVSLEVHWSSDGSLGTTYATIPLIAPARSTGKARS